MAQKKFEFKENVLNTILSNPETELKEIMLEGIKLLEFAPEVLDMIKHDIDLAAKQKKMYRLEEQAWYSRLTEPLPGFDTIQTSELSTEDLILFDGRPRKLDSEATFLMMLIRAHLDSITSRAAADRIVDSKLVNGYFESR